MTEPESLFIEAGGLRIHVAAWGEEGRPVLFLLHGMRDHARGWDWVAEAFADRYRIYAPDLRGHGDTDHPSPGAYTLPSFILDLDDVARALGVDRFAIVGHSFGGAIGIRYSSVWPEKVTGVAGIECIELPVMREYQARPRPYPQQLRSWADTVQHLRTRSPRTYASMAELEARMRSENPDLADETVSHLARHGAIVDAGGTWRWKFDASARLRSPEDADGADIDEMLEAIECPVMLAYGTNSWVPLPPAERLARIRHLTLVHFPGASHWLHHTSRADFIDAVRQFLSSVPER
jgi:pimeloyl-ACP methyl ester carboxylesterase